jgi:hypothetical protein
VRVGWRRPSATPGLARRRAEAPFRRQRSRNQFRGIVYAPDEKSAEAAAIAEFKVREDMRRRLIVRPTDE